jgi:hypothetical protein
VTGAAFAKDGSSMINVYSGGRKSGHFIDASVHESMNGLSQPFDILSFQPSQSLIGRVLTQEHP